MAATHGLDSLEEIADHCFIFQNGHVVAQGAPAALLGGSSEPACCTFTGTSTAPASSTPTPTATTNTSPDARDGSVRAL